MVRIPLLCLALLAASLPLSATAQARPAAAAAPACPALLNQQFPRLQDEKPQSLCQYAGKVLLVDSAALPKKGKPAIEWRDNVGHVSVGAEAVEVKVTPGEKTLFTLKEAGE